MEDENIITAVKDLVAENIKLKEQVKLAQEGRQKLYAREGLYQQALSNTKNALRKLYESIDTTPHSRDAAYQQLVYGEDEENGEEVS